MKTETNSSLLSKDYLGNILCAQNVAEKLEVISTGNLSLDKALGVNGIPKAKITEIFGNESCGKTTLALQIAKEATLKNQKVLFIDLESSLDVKYIRSIGIDLSLFYVAQAKSGEVTFGIIENALENNSFDLIIVDSVAAMISEMEYETKIEEANILGSHARLMSRGLRKIQPSLSKSKTALVFINQIREKIGVLFGNPETTTGGRALKFFSTIRLEVKKVDLIKSGIDKIGIKSKVTVVKNKLAKPYNSSFINIYFGEGFDNVSDLLEFAVNSNIIQKSGSWYSHNNKKLCQGIKQLKNFALENPEWYDTIKKQVLNEIENKNSIENNRQTADEILDELNN